MTVPILILAGGDSSRMGARDKLLEPVHGQPLLRTQAWRALKVSRDVTVLLRPGNHAAKRTLAGLNVRILQPNDAFEGMGGSLRGGARNMLRSRGFLVTLADLVDIDSMDMRDVLRARQQHPEAKIVRAATPDGKPGHPIFFDRSTFADLLNLRKDDGGKAVAEKFKDETVLVPLSDNRARADLDTPEAWDAWHAKKSEPET